MVPPPFVNVQHSPLLPQVGRRDCCVCGLGCEEDAPLPARRMGDTVLRGDGCLLGEGCRPEAACCELGPSWGSPRSTLMLRLTSPDLEVQLDGQIAGSCTVSLCRL